MNIDQTHSRTRHVEVGAGHETSIGMTTGCILNVLLEYFFVEKTNFRMCLFIAFKISEVTLLVNT